MKIWCQLNLRDNEKPKTYFFNIGMTLKPFTAAWKLIIITEPAVSA